MNNYVYVFDTEDKSVTKIVSAKSEAHALHDLKKKFNITKIHSISIEGEQALSKPADGMIFTNTKPFISLDKAVDTIVTAIFSMDTIQESQDHLKDLIDFNLDSDNEQWVINGRTFDLETAKNHIKQRLIQKLDTGSVMELLYEYTDKEFQLTSTEVISSDDAIALIADALTKNNHQNTSEIMGRLLFVNHNAELVELINQHTSRVAQVIKRNIALID